MEDAQEAESLDLKDWIVWEQDWNKYVNKSSAQENWVNVFCVGISPQADVHVHLFDSVFDCLFFKSVLIVIERCKTYQWNRT